jgi:hypothetical protein
MIFVISVGMVDRVASNTDLAWAAGFIDGEGCTHARQTKHGTYQVSIQVHQKGREPLDRLQEILGGKVYQTSRSGIFKWSVQRKQIVWDIMQSLWPYLTSVKKIQAHNCFEIAGWITYYNKETK